MKNDDTTKPNAIQRWISVNDRLPDIKDISINSESEDVLVLSSDGNMYVAYLNFYPISGYRTEEQYSWSDRSTGCGCCSESIDVTHWIPLPPPPKG
jgi:hypothetical protein